MRKLVLTEWVTLDGFTSGPDNDMGFVGMFFDEEMGKYEDDFVQTGDTLVLGRVTYDSFAGSWPKVPDNPEVSEDEKVYARRLNGMKKIVFSRSLDKTDWENSTVMHDIDPEVINKLKAEDGKDMLIYGSASIVQQLTNLGLIDEYQLLVHPIILGGGKPLFRDIDHQVQLECVDSRKFKSGVQLLIYRPAGKKPTSDKE